METKKETFIYKGLGFPIELIDVPMKKILGEWVIDIDLNQLQLLVYQGLIHKPFPLTGKELRFMRKFLELSTTEFGQQLGVSHVAVVKWENNTTKMGPTQEAYVRLYFLEHAPGSKQTNHKNMLNLYKEITPKKLAEAKHKKSVPIPIAAKQLKSCRI